LETSDLSQLSIFLWSGSWSIHS